MEAAISTILSLKYNSSPSLAFHTEQRVCLSTDNVETWNFSYPA